MLDPDRRGHCCTKAQDLDEPQHLIASKTELLPFYSLLQGTKSLPIPTPMQPPYGVRLLCSCTLGAHVRVAAKIRLAISNSGLQHFVPPILISRTSIDPQVFSAETENPCLDSPARDLRLLSPNYGCLTAWLQLHLLRC
jgi:hypothetical protein